MDLSCKFYTAHVHILTVNAVDDRFLMQKLGRPITVCACARRRMDSARFVMHYVADR